MSTILSKLREYLVPSVAQGQNVLRACWVGTAGFVVFALATTVSPVVMAVPMAVFSFVLLAAGSWAMLWAFLQALQRSRYEIIGVGGLYFLAGCAPKVVRRSMLTALAVQSTVAVLAASAQPFTATAFGILVPVYALGLSGVWGAKYGTFSDRAAADTKQKPYDPSRNGSDV